MKNIKTFQFLVFLIFLGAAGAIVYNYAFKPLPYEWILNVAYGILGLTISYEFTIRLVMKNENRASYLEQKLKLWNNISYRVKNAGETSFNEMPIGIIVFDDNYNIEWNNHFAEKIFMSHALVNKTIETLNKEFFEKLKEKNTIFKTIIYGKVYRVEYLVRDHVIYMTDITSETEIEERYQRRTLALGVLNLDNLDAAFSSYDAQERSLHMSNIMGILTEWVKEYNICLKGYTDERYLLIMTHQIVKDLCVDGFTVLNKIQDYAEQKEIRITASIGIATKDIDPVQLLDEANDQLDLALNRGGNQAIVKLDDQISYYGAKSASFETRTTVYIRNKTEELIKLIANASNVYIMGHKASDADSFGACLAMQKVAQTANKKSHIIIDEKGLDETTLGVYKSIQVSHSYLLDNFIDASDAIKNMDDKTLLIIVDCQYQNLLMNEKIYKKAKNIAIIDHHRRNQNAINNYKFLYIQPSASSTVELVVEMFDFAKAEFEISPIESTWMVMGVLVDTNNFIYRTTFRTFNVLSKLQSYGADTAKAQRFLRENLDEYVKRMKVLGDLEIFNDSYGIAVCDDEIYERTFLAKIADNVITVDNIRAAFCIGRISKDTIGISARSLDEANVQVIMEKLGGGGHFNNAATQLVGITKEEARQKLIEVLKEEKKGEKIMKVILIKDVKGRGKANEVIEVPAGFGNFLIKNKQAIEGTVENLKQLELNKVREQQDQEKHLREMQELKIKIESVIVKVAVKVGANGKLFGSVSTKEIVDEFKKQNNIELDKRKILYDKVIDCLGTYKIPIELHKEVIATITLYVIEGNK